MRRLLAFSFVLALFLPSFSLAQLKLEAEKALAIQIQPLPKCKGYQFRTQFIYGPNDPGVESVLTKMNSINFYKMQDIGYDLAYMEAAFNDLVNFLALVQEFYSQNPVGTKLAVKFPCIPKNVLPPPPRALKTADKMSPLFFADPAFIALLAVPQSTPLPEFDVLGEGDGPYFPEPVSDWDLYGDFSGDCWVGGVTHSSGFGLELGGCAGDDGFGLGVGTIGLTMDVITVWENYFSN